MCLKSHPNGVDTDYTKIRGTMARREIMGPPPPRPHFGVGKPRGLNARLTVGVDETSGLNARLILDLRQPEEYMQGLLWR